MRLLAAARHLTVPNAFSLLRVALAPAMVLAALAGQDALYVLGLGLSIVSDYADGLLARRLRQTSPLGAQLDSWADCAMILSATAGFVRLQPDLSRAEAPFLIVALASYALPLGVGFVRYRRILSYHTRGERWAAALLVGSGVVYLLNQDTRLFRLAVAAVAVAHGERLLMALALPTWHADVRSLACALRLRGRSYVGPAPQAVVALPEPQDEGAC